MGKLSEMIARELQEWKRPSHQPIAETPGGKFVAGVVRALHPPRINILWRGPDTFESPTDGPGSAAYK